MNVRIQGEKFQSNNFMVNIALSKTVPEQNIKISNSNNRKEIAAHYINTSWEGLRYLKIGMSINVKNLVLKNIGQHFTILK